MSRRKQSATVDLKLRVKEPLRAAIERAARHRGISMNAEMVRRLEQTTQRDERLGGPRVASILETVATAMRTTGEHGAFVATSKRHHEGAWLDHPYAFDQAVKASQAVLEAFRPDGKIVVPVPEPTMIATTASDAGDADVARIKKELKWVYEHLGEGFARGVLDREEKK